MPRRRARLLPLLVLLLVALVAPAARALPGVPVADGPRVPVVDGLRSGQVTSPSPARLQDALAQRLDTARADARLVVFVHGTSTDAARRAATQAGLVTVTAWDAIDTVVAVGTSAQVQLAAAQPNVTYLEMDRPATLLTDTSHQATRGQEVFDGEHPELVDPQGRIIDGTNVSIAIVDSGIDGTHPMLTADDGTSKVVRNVKSGCPFLNAGTQPDPVIDTCFVDVATNDSDTPSAGGHGTHVASIAAGRRVTTSDGAHLSGAAPGARLVGVSVGQSLSVYGGAQGLYWVLQHHDDPCAGDLTGASATCPPIRVVNNSWGPSGGGSFDPSSAVVAIQRKLVEAGVAVVWAAGNDGGDGSQNLTNPPGEDPTGGILMVANYDDADSGTRDGSIAPSSSRGKQGDTSTYPDIAAPGTNIRAACRPYLTVCSTGLDTRDPDYNTISGTSMAAPHIAGILAQLFQADPTLTPADAEHLIIDNAHEFGARTYSETDVRYPQAANGTTVDAGHGLVDAAEAVAAALGVTIGEPQIAACPTDARFTDDPGDATAILGVATPLPNAPSLDILSGWLTTDATNAVTFHVSVADLPDTPGGLSGQGEWFDINFTYAGAGYDLVATRDASGSSFRLTQLGTTGRQTLVDGLPGTFDPANDEISVTLGANVIAGAVPGAPVFTSGARIEGLSVVARRQLVVLVPDADTAVGTCAYTIGA